MKSSALKNIKIAVQHGLSLIELMISITIGLLILAALSTLFVNQSRTRTELDKSNRMIDNGRYALELLTDNLKLAGYYGEFVPSPGVPAIPAALTDPCSTNQVVIRTALQLAIQGVEAAKDATPAFSDLCAAVATAAGDTLRSGSDILVIRRVSTAAPITVAVATAAATAGTTLYLQVSLCQFDVAPYVLDRVIANFTLRNTVLNIGCNAGSVALADLRPFMTQVYFVSRHNNNNPADSIPTLKRMDLDPATNTFVITPLVEGIEYMQLDYGLDTTVPADGVADNYIQAPAATDWPNIVAVKVNILARNTESTTGYTDTKTYDLGLTGSVTPGGAFKRHAYTQLIRLNNPAGRRDR